MDPFVRRFIRASVLWLGVGVIIGLAMIFWPMQGLSYRPAHVHANLLGFVSMMIFGVAYHVVPRFSGAPLQYPRLAGVHLWIANLGLILMVSGWIGRVWWRTPGELVLRIGASVSAVGALLFIFNIWRTLDAAAEPHPLARRVVSR